MKKILVVEDNLDIVNLLELVLSREFEVVVATDGSEGARRFQEENFDLIITDYLMPRMNGLEFIGQVKQLGYTGQIIVSSSHLSDEVAGKFEQLNIQHFFKKPYIINDLVDFICDIFKKQKFNKR